jgi:arylsulfatase A-like enzyme
MTKMKSGFGRMAVGLLAASILAGSAMAADAQARQHNVILFVADGLRAASVTPQSAPAMSGLAAKGVLFRNSHSIYPTLTTVNAAALATGHLPGDTGEFGNVLFLGFNSLCPRPPAGVVGPVAFMENDCVLDDADTQIGGGENYLNETSVLAAAQARGFSTASVGKLGPTRIQDVRRSVALGDSTIIIDDTTNRAGGQELPVSDDLLAAIRMAGLPDEALGRADNGDSGGVNVRGTHFANDYQQTWFADVAAKVLLPRFKAAGKPFAMVFWSRDPDGTQHNEGDSFQTLTPGINGPTSAAAVRNADNDLAELLAALKAQGLDATTDVIVVADHGFSTIGRDSATSQTTRSGYDSAPYGLLPPGFVALDLASALDLPMYEPSDMAKPSTAVAIDTTRTGPHSGDALLGPDPATPQVVVAANGGSDLIYLPGGDAQALAPRIVAALQAQDYTGGIFVRDDLGRIPGTLRFSDIGLQGTALTPTPAIVVGFRTYTAPGCTLGPLLCNVEIADTPLQVGQGMHGTFSRPDTNNFMAAKGPDFKAGYVDTAPVSNADIGVTLARLLGLAIAPKGELLGRVPNEALAGGAETPTVPGLVHSAPGPGGLTMTLVTQTAGGHVYYDAAGYPGRVVGVN